MKKIFGISLFLIAISSVFFALQAQTFRVEAGYSQPRIYSNEISNRYFHGFNLGVTAEFAIPQVEFLSLYTGISYVYMFGNNSQHSRFGSGFNDSIRISTQAHQLRIPIHLQASQSVWAFRGTVFAGPSINIGLTMPQEVSTNINPEFWNLASLNGFYRLGETTDLHADRMRRINLQFDAGLSLEWWRLLLRGGYSFGINNLNKWQPAPELIELPNGTTIDINSRMSNMRLRQSGWFVSLGYRF